MLAGLICGNTARGLGLFDATVVSAYVMGVASENCTLALSDYCVTAKEILKELPKVVKSLTNNA
jgi:NAD(P)H-hydrate repair Nnr-like enzyme with NAD(P)H-hydrate dehydratase domain